jgi:hypothetical protein
MAAVNLTGTNVTYDTSAPKFGTGAISGGYAAATGILPTGAFTIEAWVTTTATSIRVAAGQSNAVFMGIDASGNAFAHYGSSTDVALTSTTKINDGVYHHLAVSYDPAVGGKLFSDGVLVAQSAVRPTFDTANPFAFHDFGGNYGTYLWTGKVDEGAIWSIAKYTANFTPPTSPYVGSETGLAHLYHFDSATTDSFGTAPAAATTYTLAGPASGPTGLASSSFTVTASGSLSSAVTVTPASSVAGDTFSPATVTLAAGSNTSATFTLTSASAGARSVSTTNNGGLTDPATLTYTSVSSIGITNAAFHFSPANWKGDTGRGGSAYRQTWNAGAYFDFTFTAGASPSLSLLLGNNANSLPISYFVNGILYDNVATVSLSSLAISGLVANVANTVQVYVRSSPSTSRWGGTNTLQIQGAILDSGSAPGVAPAPTKWVLYGGDSINEGWVVDSGASNFLHGSTFFAAQELRRQGYDVGVVAATGSGFTVAGNGNVPALYAISGGAYVPASSRWNLLDSGVSLLDSAGQISGYGGTGQTPSVILWNYGTNDGQGGTPAATLTASVTGVLGAYVTAAPGAKIILVPGAPLTAGTASNATTTQAAMLAGFNAAVTANPSASLTYFDLGKARVSQIYTVSGYSVDSLHPALAGNAFLVGPLLGAITQQLGMAAANSSVFLPQFRPGFH